MTNASRIHVNRRALLKGAAAGTAAALAAPMVARADSKIDQDRHADHPVRPRRAARHFVAQRGDDGSREGQRRRRPRRPADRDGDPRFRRAAAGSGALARELVNTDGCEILIDAEASSGAFAVHEVARDLGVLCLHTNSETCALTADPKLRIPNAFRTCRQGIHDSIVGGAYAANDRQGQEA